MLTELWLGNFIHFKNQEYFKFNKGLNILLGPNHTGKTSVFEAIRRCMSLKLNGGLSNSHDANKISYVISTFKNKLYGKSTVAVSSIIRIRSNIDNNEPFVTLKCVHFTNEQGEQKAIDIVRQKGLDLVNKQLPTDAFDFTVLSKTAEQLQIKTLRDEKHNDKYEGEIEKAVGRYEERLEDAIKQYLGDSVVNDQLKSFFATKQTKIDDTTAETILQKHVDEEAVIIFPFRSFATRQWTRSKRDMKEIAVAGDNYDEITMKKEIICWYLKNNEEKNTNTESLEEKYFDLITGNSLFRFKLDKHGRVRVYVGDNPTQETLLKVPEGIYEAKSAAIVLADPQFQTICLDDAERGMHPQMIERFRDLVLQDIDDKAVLVITHHPTFLAPWNIDKTFFFQRRADVNGYQFSVKHLKRYAEQIGGKGPQIITSGQFPSLFFAERICWVEGKTEYLFMTALKYVLVQTDSPFLKNYCREDEKQMKRFRDFLSTLHVVSMDGEAGKCLFRDICQALGITHYFILDFDALTNNLKRLATSTSQVQETGSKSILLKFCKVFGLKSEDIETKNIDTANDIVAELQRHGIFVWKLTKETNHSSGNIENAVDRMSKHRELQKILKDKNMQLRQKRKRKTTDRGDKVEKFGKDMGMGDKDISELWQFLNSKHIVQKIETTRCCEEETKFEKLFKDTNIKNDDIREVVECLLNPEQKYGGSANVASVDSSDNDFHRLVTFLIERCETETATAESKPIKRGMETTVEETSSDAKQKQRRIETTVEETSTDQPNAGTSTSGNV